MPRKRKAPWVQGPLGPRGPNTPAMSARPPTTIEDLRKLTLAHQRPGIRACSVARACLPGQ